MRRIIGTPSTWNIRALAFAGKAEKLRELKLLRGDGCVPRSFKGLGLVDKVADEIYDWTVLEAAHLGNCHQLVDGRLEPVNHPGVGRQPTPMITSFSYIRFYPS